MKVSDFKALGKLPDVYELQPGTKYLVIVDGKKFPYGMAQGLLRKAQEDGIDLHIIATLYPRSIKVGTEAPKSGEGSPADAGAAEQAGKEGSGTVPESD